MRIARAVDEEHLPRAAIPTLREQHAKRGKGERVGLVALTSPEAALPPSVEESVLDALREGEPVEGVVGRARVERALRVEHRERSRHRRERDWRGGARPTAGRAPPIATGSLSLSLSLSLPLSLARALCARVLRILPSVGRGDTNIFIGPWRPPLAPFPRENEGNARRSAAAPGAPHRAARRGRHHSEGARRGETRTLSEDAAKQFKHI